MGTKDPKGMSGPEYAQYWKEYKAQQQLAKANQDAIAKAAKEARAMFRRGR